MNRRHFLALAGGTILAPAALTELLTPTRTIFLPPRGGWATEEIVTISLLSTEESRRLRRMIDELMALIAKANSVPEGYLRGGA